MASMLTDSGYEIDQTFLEKHLTALNLTTHYQEALKHQC